jgi:alkylation response protein AidB-like acyl-CoA dehydrogenase
MPRETLASLETFRREVRTFFAEEYPRTVLDALARGDRLSKQDHIASQTALNAKGWLGVSWPKEDGGPGWSPMQRYIFDCELDLAGAAGIIPMGVIYIGPILCAFGSPEQKERWLPDILNSKSFWVQGYSEPESGSDLASLRLSAVREGDHYILNGAKIWTSGAHWADWIFCLARTSKEARKQDGISLICADMRSPGVTVHPIPLIDGAAELNRVEFDNVRVPVENRIGDEGRGWHYANVLLKNERLSYAHIGAKRRDIAKLRRMAEARPLSAAERTAFHARLSEAEIRVDMIEATILRALASEIEMATAAMLKIACTESVQEIDALATDLAGMSATLMLDRHQSGWQAQAPLVDSFGPSAIQTRFFNRAQTIYGGATEIQKNILWRTLGG